MKFMLDSIRAVEAADQPILWDLLYEALWDPPTSPRRPKSVLSNPQIAAYVQDWGSHATDLGFLAISREGSVAGGILSRLLLPPLQGGAFYDANTPQLGIAVFPAFQRQGLGTTLFTRYLAAASARFLRVSLGVHPENHAAIRLYRTFGFYQFATGNGGYLNMVKDMEKRLEPGAAPNGGPATPSANSGVTDGPPSVSLGRQAVAESIHTREGLYHNGHPTHIQYQ